MRFRFLLVAFAGSAFPHLAMSASSNTSVVHTITVGNLNANVFSPNVVQANVGDIVSFQFYPANHSVAKSQYGYPCIPYEDVGPGRTGWFSGFQPVAAVTNNV